MAKEATFYGTGRRKSSVARVFITPGTGNMTINGRTIDDYFGLETLKVIVNQPIVLTGTTGQYDYKITVKGGGTTGQAGAIRHGISQAQSVTASPVPSSRQTRTFVPFSKRPDILPVTLV